MSENIRMRQINLVKTFSLILAMFLILQGCLVDKTQNKGLDEVDPNRGPIDPPAPQPSWIAPTVGNNQVFNTYEDTAISFPLEAGTSSIYGLLQYELFWPPLINELTGCLNFVDRYSRNCTYDPVGDAFGQLSFSYKVFDGVMRSEQVAVVTINIISVNDAPTISDLPSTLGFAEGANGSVTFKVDEGGGPYEDVQSLGLKISSSNEDIIKVSDLMVGAMQSEYGTYSLSDGNLDANITPITLTVNPADANVNTVDSGPVTITIVVTDDNGQTWYDRSDLIVSIEPPNSDPPSIVNLISGDSLIYNVITDEDTMLFAHPFGIDEGGGPSEDSQDLQVLIATSDTSREIVDLNNITASWGIIPLIVAGEGCVDPTLENESICVDQGQRWGRLFNVNDVGTADASLHPFYLNIMPNLNKNTTTTESSTPVTVWAYIRDRDSGDPNFAPTYAGPAFLNWTINADNDSPKLVSVTPDLLRASEGADINFNIRVDEGGGEDEDGQRVQVTITAPNQAVVDSRAHIDVNDTRTNTFIEPDDEDANSSLISVKVTPGVNPDFEGTLNFTIEVDDGINKTIETRQLTWASIDDRPTIVNLSGDANILEDTSLIGHKFRIDEGGSSGENYQSLAIQVTSSNIQQIPTSAISAVWNGVTLSRSGDTPTETFFVGDGNMDALISDLQLNITPPTDATSTSLVTGNIEPVLITVTVNESNDNDDWPTSQKVSFNVTINPVNDPPTISDPDYTGEALTINEDDPNNAVVSFTTDEGGLDFENYQSLEFKLSSSNPSVFDINDVTASWNGSSIVADGNGVFAIGDGSVDSSNFPLRLELVANGEHVYSETPVSFTMLLKDSETMTWDPAEPGVVSKNFKIIVLDVNDEPTISSQENFNITIDEGITIPHDANLLIDEGGGSAEDSQSIFLRVYTSDSNFVSLSDIQAKWGGTTLLRSNTDPNYLVYYVGDGSSDANSSLLTLSFLPANPDINTTSQDPPTPVDLTICISDDGQVPDIDEDPNVTLRVTIQPVDDPPVFYEPNVLLNRNNIPEGSPVNFFLTLDEGGGADEDDQQVTIRITSSDQSVVNDELDINVGGSGSNVYTSTEAAGASTHDSDANIPVEISLSSNVDYNGTVEFKVELSDESATPRTFDVYQTFTIDWDPNDDLPTIALVPSDPNAFTILENNTLDVAFQIDEGGGVSEDYQGMKLKVTSTPVDNPNDTNMLDNFTLEATWGGTSMSQTSTTTVSYFTVNDRGLDANSASVQLKVTPNDNYSTQDTNGIIFTVDVCDQDGLPDPQCWDVNTVAAVFKLDVTSVNDKPTIARNTANDSYIVLEDEVFKTNRSSGIYLSFDVDEGGGIDEDIQGVEVRVSVDNPTLFPSDNIRVYFGKNRAMAWTNRINVNGTDFTDLIFDRATIDTNYIDDTNDLDPNYNVLDANDLSLMSGKMFLDIVPNTDLESGTHIGDANIIIEIRDDATPTEIVTETIKVSVQNAVATHGGWGFIGAIGSKRDANDILQDGDAGKAQLKFNWSDVIAYENIDDVITPVSSTGWAVYRSRKMAPDSNDNNFDFASPILILEDSASRTYSDTNLVDPDLTTGEVKWYRVRPVINGIITATNEVDLKSVRIVIPPPNKALIHRWSVNQEICGKIGRETDRFNHFRCEYSGPGNFREITDPASNGYTDYYDLGYDLLVDRFEAGCNFSGTTVCSGNGCLGVTDPSDNVVAQEADRFYYDRSTGECLTSISAGSTEWETIADVRRGQHDSTDPADMGAFINMQFNKAKLPPLTHLNQLEAQLMCNSTVNDLNFTQLSSLAFSARLLSRKEQIATTAWNSTDHASIANVEEEVCNTDLLDGLLFTNTNLPASGLGDYLPGIYSTGIRLVVTASTNTRSCVSRYGVQDMVGNVKEWTSDRIFCALEDGRYCSQVSEDFNEEYFLAGASDDFSFFSKGIPFRYSLGDPNVSQITGPCADVLDAEGKIEPDGVCDPNTAIGSWKIAEPQFDAKKFFLPMGLPADSQASPDFSTFLLTGEGATLPAENLHDDVYIFDTDKLLLDETTMPEPKLSYTIAATGGGTVQDVVVVNKNDGTEYAIVAEGLAGLRVYKTEDGSGVDSYTSLAGPALKLALVGTSNVLGAFGPDGIITMGLRDSASIFDSSNLNTYDTLGSAKDIIHQYHDGIGQDVAYVADDQGGLVILNVTQALLASGNTPQLLSTYIESQQALGVDVNGNLAVVADGVNGVVFVDITLPNAPVSDSNTIVSENATAIAYDVAMDANYAYVAYGVEGLMVVDLSSSPKEVVSTFSGYATNPDARYIEVKNNYVYISDRNNGLVIVNLIDRTVPHNAGLPIYQPQSPSWGLTLTSNDLFITAEVNGLEVLSLFPEIINPGVGGFVTGGSFRYDVEEPNEEPNKGNAGRYSLEVVSPYKYDSEEIGFRCATPIEY
ncbi:MAG: hypothetical protein ISR65_02460 [Bacteriovoracaceae bacterium]|nr:hypothetical protein [Bacteriovoracaceae bacterium]